MKDYYDILGLPRNASQEDIKRSYRILAQQFHPDKENGNEKRFKEVNEAYRILSGASTKANYDAKYDAGLFEEEESPTPPQKPPQSVQNYATSPFINFISRGGWLLILIVLGVGVSLFSKSADSNNQTLNFGYSSSTELSNSGVSPSDLGTDFPMQSTSCNTQGCPQYSWYDSHNVAMAYRCYPGSQCTAQQWAYAIYGDRNDPRGEALKAQAALVNGTVSSQYPAGKCVTESGVEICDLSYNTTGSTGGNRTVKMKGNEIICQDFRTGNTTDVSGDSTAINYDPQVCATDYGSVYIDPSVNVAKHYGEIISGRSYVVPSNYGPCIWTYNGGNGNIPYIRSGTYLGPENSFFNVHAFCQNGSNEIDIFTTST